MASAQRRPAQAARYEIVDLFAGPGGLDVAAHWLGIPVQGVEWDDDAYETRLAAGLSTVHGDVRDFGPSDFPHANVLAGGPPCQTYTVAGAGSGRRALNDVLSYVKQMAAGIDVTPSAAAFEDERTGLVLQPLRWIVESYKAGIPYEAVILEQVPAVLPVWEAMAEALEGFGYKTACGVLRSEEYGVPQTRRRAVLVANREFTPTLPTPTHRSYRKGLTRIEGQSALHECATMRDALAHLPSGNIRGEFEVVSNYGSGGDPRARGRRRSSEPSATVTGKISRNRIVDLNGVEQQRFTTYEAGLLQTFPYDFPWSGRAISQQIGNAIPPRLGVHVLAAALGLDLDPREFDVAVQECWSHSKHGVLQVSTGQ